MSADTKARRKLSALMGRSNDLNNDVHTALGRLGEATAMSDPQDIAVIREWHAKHSNPSLRYSTMPADVAQCWEWIATLLTEVDRRIDPDTLDDRETGIYEAGYVAGQDAVAVQLHQFAAALEGDGDE